MPSEASPGMVGRTMGFFTNYPFSPFHFINPCHNIFSILHRGGYSPVESQALCFTQPRQETFFGKTLNCAFLFSAKRSRYGCITGSCFLLGEQGDRRARSLSAFSGKGRCGKSCPSTRKNDSASLVPGSQWGDSVIRFIAAAFRWPRLGQLTWGGTGSVWFYTYLFLQLCRHRCRVNGCCDSGLS